jgi:hypothetical protein
VRNRVQSGPGLLHPLKVTLPDVLSVPVPPGLAEMLGYPCVPPERFVCYFWSVADAGEGPQLVWFDGSFSHYADPSAWMEYTTHWLVASGLTGFALGGPGDNGVRPSRDCLLLDAQENCLRAVPVGRGCALARRVGGNVLRGLPLSQGLQYTQASLAVLRPPADLRAEHVQALQAKRLADLRAWLNGDALPF